ncbi:unnamed protein product [Cylicocyclus nassatus]|uniref:Uncharacterized protein n=1 Tax=Cylicocyclus nassatus TaxID=53992 RepID=A0AA36GR57_CYLNA|nr:unnamed protein product [Cylicocyclus nassatus]
MSTATRSASVRERSGKRPNGTWRLKLPELCPGPNHAALFLVGIKNSNRIFVSKFNALQQDQAFREKFDISLIINRNGFSRI